MTDAKTPIGIRTEYAKRRAEQKKVEDRASVTREIVQTLDEYGTHIMQARVISFTDGIVTVRWREADFQVGYVDRYSPAVNDMVLMLIEGTFPVIIGKLMGVPPDVTE